MKLSFLVPAFAGLISLVGSLAAQNVDNAITESAVNTNRYYIEVEVMGSGTITPNVTNLNGHTFAWGSHHTLVAQPKTGNLFTGWNGSITSSSKTLTFTLTSNVFLTATFVTNPFLAVQGTYVGLDYPTAGVNASSSGPARVTVTSGGGYSAQLFVAGTARSISGQFSLSGLATNKITLSRSNVVTVHLQLDLNGSSPMGSNSISGALISPTLTNSLTAYRSGLFAHTNDGGYTFAIAGTSGSTNLPAGDGVGSIKISSGGSAIWSLNLADGTVLSSLSTSVSQNGFAPISQSLYSGKGFILGWLTISGQSGGDVSGLLQWIKPGQHTAAYYPVGFTNFNARVIGSRFFPSNSTPILATTNLLFSVSQGNLPSAITNEIELQKADKITSTNKTLKFTVTPSTGLFTGSVSNIYTNKHLKTLSFHGAFLQKQQAGVGFFLGTNQSGLLNIGADPFAASAGPAGVVVLTGTDTLLTNLGIGEFGSNVQFSAGPLGDITVSLPPGAVTSNVTISLSSNSGDFTPQSGTAAGYILNLQVNSNSANFGQPISITIPYPTNGNVVPVPYYISSNGALVPCQVVSIDTNAGMLTFQTFHASLYTWILAQLGLSTTTAPATAYLPWADGFQVGNPGSVYNPGGECLGMCAFEQWFFENEGGGFYPLFMQSLPLPSGGTILGQEIIRTRAFDSVAQLWSDYLPAVQNNYNLPAAYRMASMINVLDNTHIPTILNPFGNGSHAILAYDHTNNGSIQTLLINDPNFPGTTQTLSYDPANSNVLSYKTFPAVALIGEGSFQAEGFENIYADALLGFDGSGAAQVKVTSDTDGEHIMNRNINLVGTIDSGQVLVSELDIVLNSSETIATSVDQSGYFSVELSLNSGTNTLGFVTKGINGNGNLVQVPNTQKQPFQIIEDVTNAVILATLTWNTDNTDLDLYTIDPTGDYSCYYHHTTASGGNLDFDQTEGYGPEHWTLSTANTIQWGGTYTFRVHYYDDHVNDIPGPAIPTQWTVNVLLYEGTPNMQSSTFNGELDYHDASDNAGPDGTGASWADVCTVVPIQADEEHARPAISRGPHGKIIITVPVPSMDEQIQIKTNEQGNAQPDAPRKAKPNQARK
jgi:uncharacterized protein YfaP (DUF2135 family)